MLKYIVSIVLFLISIQSGSIAGKAFEKDIVKTAEGDLEITFFGHGSMMFTFGGKVIHIDPFSGVADYSKLPQADMILLTHEHRDHLDLKAIEFLRTEKTVLVLTETCGQQIKGGIVMHNGDIKNIEGLKIEAMPAYNLVHTHSEGVPYHPKGSGNGYVITFGDRRIYVAGDTENIPEMKKLKDIDYAFLPMNLPYTMTPEMVADAAKAFKPKILYPYHYGETDPSELVALMADTPQVEIRIRKMP
jgi:L-ascorbate metabolism protein UlaG (beta-lactamase superfamily)